MSAREPWRCALEAEHEAERQAEEDRANENATLVHQARAERDDALARIAEHRDACTLPFSVDRVDWDSPTWGGGTHTAAWAADGTHDDITEEE